MCALVVDKFNPHNTPLASSLLCGAESPEKAGTKYTFAVSGIEVAILCVCISAREERGANSSEKAGMKYAFAVSGTEVAILCVCMHVQRRK